MNGCRHVCSRNGRKNNNLFTGDFEYKSAPWLDFKLPYTFMRFKNDTFQRFRLLIRATVVGMAILCFGFWKGYFIVALALSLLSCGMAFYFTKMKFSPLYARGCLVLFEVFWQHMTFSSQDFSTHLILFNLPTLFSNVLLLYCWYLHLGISVLFSILRMLAISDMTFPHFIWEVGIISLTTTVHGFIERAIKENWVLFDSYKKSEKIYMKLADEIFYPVFITDSNGRVYYFNKKGGELFKNLNADSLQESQILLSENAISLIHPEYKEKVEDALKKAVKESIEPFEVPIRHTTPQSEGSRLLRGYHSDIIEQGFQFYRLLFERIPWKASNCIMITCENKTNKKLSYERLLDRCNANRQLLKQVYSNVEARTIQKKRENDINTLINLRNLLQENELTAIAAMKHLNQVKFEKSNMYILEELQYIMELYSTEAHLKEIKVIFEFDPCTPTTVSGDCAKFLILIQNIFVFCIENTENVEIKLFARLIFQTSSGWRLGFEFTTPAQYNLTARHFLELYESNYMGSEVLSSASERLSLCKIIINELEGSINISEGSEGKLSIAIEILFETTSNDFTFEAPPRLTLFETKKPTEYRTIWTSNPISPPPKKSTCQNEDALKVSDEAQNLLKSKMQAQAMNKLNKNASDLKNSLLANIKAKKDSASASPSPALNESQVIESGGTNQPFGSGEYLSPGFENFAGDPKEEKKSTFCEMCPDQEDESSGEYVEEETTIVNCMPPFETPKSKQSLSKKSAIKRRKLKWRRFMAGQDLEMPENQTERRKNQHVPTQTYQEGALGRKQRALWKKDQIVAESKQDIGDSEEIKVLIVEDNAFNILPIQTTLKRHKIPYDLAYNGDMAVDRFKKAKAEKCRYGVILMDIEMPIMNGFDATMQIRKIEKASHMNRTYICGLSAHQNDEIKIPCMNCGMDLSVTKPVAMDQMLKIINKQLALLQNK